MTRKPSKATIAEDERRLVERQRGFRLVADRLVIALAKCAEVEAIALIGSVAAPLRREVPRFHPYRTLGLPIVHECGDLDLAVWVSGVDRLNALRLARVRANQSLIAEQGFSPAVQEMEIFLLEPQTDRYLGRVCAFRECPAQKRDCQAAGCGAHPYLKQHDDFTFWPAALAPGAAVRLYDRNGGGIIARAADLPLIVLEAEQEF